jgi:hypothetical protein
MILTTPMILTTILVHRPHRQISLPLSLSAKDLQNQPAYLGKLVVADAEKIAIQDPTAAVVLDRADALDS